MNPYAKPCQHCGSTNNAWQEMTRTVDPDGEKVLIFWYRCFSCRSTWQEYFYMTSDSSVICNLHSREWREICPYCELPMIESDKIRVSEVRERTTHVCSNCGFSVVTEDLAEHLI